MSNRKYSPRLMK